MDILFVVDNSGSMSNDQTNLSVNFSSFINFALTLNVDYHIGITTTDTEGNFNPFNPNSTPGQLVGNPPWVDRNTPNAIDTFKNNVKVGDSGSADEKGLAGAYLALSDPQINTPPPNGNQGFMREDAPLFIVIISDEADKSPETIDFYLNYFQNLKRFRQDYFTASAIVGDTPNGCTRASDNTTAQAAPRYIDFATRSGGLWETICTDNWSTTLETIGSHAFGLKTQYFLTRQPEGASITVETQPSGGTRASVPMTPPMAGSTMSSRTA